MNNKLTMAKETESVVLALDYGVKKTGVAMGNTISQNARPYDILPMDNGQPNWGGLLTIINDWQIAQIVIGLPLNMDGTESALAKRASKFARRLAHKLMEQKNPCKVYLYDERLTSREAREMAWENGWIKNERDPIDDVSACILLNSYFNSRFNAQLGDDSSQNESMMKDVTAYGSR